MLHASDTCGNAVAVIRAAMHAVKDSCDTCCQGEVWHKVYADITRPIATELQDPLRAHNITRPSKCAAHTYASSVVYACLPMLLLVISAAYVLCMMPYQRCLCLMSYALCGVCLLAYAYACNQRCLCHMPACVLCLMPCNVVYACLHMLMLVMSAAYAFCLQGIRHAYACSA